MDYERLPVILKRYSFIEKMRVLQYYSKQIMNINGIELTSGQPMAWELETFLLFAVKADEYNDNDFKGKNINKFIEMINCIKEHQHPTLVNKIGTIEFADFLLIALGSTQFDIQTYNIYKYYRYNYFFTYVSDKIDMKKEFYKKFNVDYNSFLELGSILSFFYLIVFQELITDSLLYRLTDSNSELRSLFWKNVLEDYLFEVLNKSFLFDEVLKEKCYKKKHNALKTSDVMCRKNDNYIFFECKSTVPYAKTRCLDENYIKQEIDKISNYVLQLYKQDRIVLQFFK